MQLTAPTGAPWDFVAGGDPRTYADLVTPAGLRQVARYADALGPDKTQIVPRDGAGALLPATTLVRDAHRAGLAVHAVHVPERERVPAGGAALRRDPGAYGDAFAEYAQFLRLGVDGLFTDNGDTAREARDRRGPGRRRRAAG